MTSPSRVVLPFVLVAALAGCKKPAPSTKFPDNFVFGVATAGFQNEMGCAAATATTCEDQNSDWYQWITDSRILANPSAVNFTGGPPTTGPDFFDLYPQDLALAKNDMGVSAVRLSIEWSRIFPTSTVGVTGYAALKNIASPAGIAFYHSLFAELKEDGLTPLVTINHYTLPLWINDGADCHFNGLDSATCVHKGWLDPGTITEIAKYAGFLGQEYGGEVDLWATENEPLAVPLSGYLEPGPSRENPPGIFLAEGGVAAKTVIFAEIQAHAAMYDAVKAADLIDADGDGKAAEIGLVFNMAPVYPVDPTNELDTQAAANTFYLYDELFLDALINGQLDENAAGKSTQVSQPQLARMDYLGINYYNRINVAGMYGSLDNNFSPLLTFDFTNPATNFYVLYPRGIYEMIRWVEKTYNNIPIYITENGTSQGAGDPTAPGDCARYLQWVQQAIAEGADVRGYFWWTLTDNYEWNHGMTENFGLYAVDPETKTRTLRPLGQTYAKIVAAREVTADLVSQYPVEVGGQPAQ